MNQTETAGRSTILMTGIVACGLAVALGALGAHALQASLGSLYDADIATRKLDNWVTGVRYQMWHGLGLILLGLLMSTARCRTRLARLTGVCFASGIVLFSGGLYLWVLSDWRPAVMVVPVGGVIFLVGWCLFGAALVTGKSTKK